VDSAPPVFALLPRKTLPVIVIGPFSWKIAPPPKAVAALPAKVELITLKVVSKVCTAPPVEIALPPQLVTVRLLNVSVVPVACRYL
jgi:hypothetical protein